MKGAAALVRLWNSLLKMRIRELCRLIMRAAPQQRVIVAFFLLLIVAACGKTAEVKEEVVDVAGKNSGFLSTEDGLKIAYNYWDNPSSKAVVLLHQLSLTKESWHQLPGMLNSKYKVIAIDLRGHGQSEGNLHDFGNDDFRRIMLDLNEAMQFLKEKGATEFAIVGASIGANLAFIKAGEDSSVKAVVLLSPGLDYRGLKTEPVAQNVKAASLLVSASGDTYSAQTVRVLGNVMNIQPLLLDGKEHGTRMFDGNLENTIIGFISKNL